jgi:hypothetical protein
VNPQLLILRNDGEVWRQPIAYGAVSGTMPRTFDRLAHMAAKKKAKKSSAKKPQTRRPAPKKSAKKGSARKSASTRKRARSGPSVRKPQGRVQSLRGDADSQGLSEVERADSESVGELLEEGNAFEAGVVEGVEQADDSEGREVRTREVPEDDVPEEYLDKD